MQAILAIELKGFTLIADSLALKMENLELTPERVRVSTIEIIKNLLDSLNKKYIYNESHYIGGDTFFVTFSDLEISLKYASDFLHLCKDLVLEKGLYYIKPNLCIGWGDIKTEGARFYDNTSINSYRVADKVPPYSLWLTGSDTIKEFKKLNKYIIKSEKDEITVELEWANIVSDTSFVPDIKIPTLLLENEIVFSNSASDSLSKITAFQKEAKIIYAFGGPIPFENAERSDYLKNVIADIKAEEKKWVVISYLENKDVASGYYWLELARRLQNLHPNQYSFTAYIIPEKTLIPFSYQIFDTKVVHLGLRSYSIEQDKATMSAAILFKSKRIAERYKDEFTENYRQLKKFNDKDFARLISEFGQINPLVIKECNRVVDLLLK
jgi:hypothetical protein